MALWTHAIGSRLLQCICLQRSSVPLAIALLLKWKEKWFLPCNFHSDYLAVSPGSSSEHSFRYFTVKRKKASYLLFIQRKYPDWERHWENRMPGTRAGPCWSHTVLQSRHRSILQVTAKLTKKLDNLPKGDTPASRKPDWEQRYICHQSVQWNATLPSVIPFGLPHVSWLLWTRPIKLAPAELSWSRGRIWLMTIGSTGYLRWSECGWRRQGLPGDKSWW